MSPIPRIGIFDSGVGGLTVLKALIDRIPRFHSIYYADTAHVPYGPRSPEEIRTFALSISRFLVGEGADLVVMGCNMSSALALEEVRAALDVPVIGVVQPGATAAVAATRSGRIAVLATEGTVRSHVYAETIRHVGGNGVRVWEQACPEFVPLIETGETCGPTAHSSAARTLAPVIEFGADVCVFGCTHYPLMRQTIAEVLGDGVALLDPAESAAEVVAAMLGPVNGNGHPERCERRYLASGPGHHVPEYVSRVIGEENIFVEPAPVFDPERAGTVRN